MFDTVFGLPMHPLVVHATAVIVPLAALAVILQVCYPRFRAWAGPLPAALSLLGLVLTPLSTATGESLEEKVAESSLVEKHAELGDQLLPLTIALFVFSAGFWWLDRRRQQLATTAAPVIPTVESTNGATTTLTAVKPAHAAVHHDNLGRWRTATAVVGVLAVLAAVATGIQVARIGHSGAKAAWSDVTSSSAVR
jgi:hypothetical protein